MICTRHSHSSDETAKRCYAKWVQKELERRLGTIEEQMANFHGYAQIGFNPPKPVELANVTVYYFYGGKRYG